MLGCSYWDTFVYDAVNDSVKDNSHLWAKFFDACIGVSIALGLKVTPELFYRGLFGQCMQSIRKGKDTFQGRTAKKNIGYPGLQLIILVDHMVSESEYADYSYLQPIIPYRFIKGLYTAQLSSVSGEG
jgi:hypothetical protein